jgi:AcrR family transcriptional regulator
MAKGSRKAQQRTRGGHAPTGTSAKRRAKAASGASAKGERTRAAIVAAARTVFERDGYFDARVSDIVGEAGIAHGSYYTYFSSKRSVFQAVVDAVRDEIDIAVGPSPDDIPGDQLTNLLRANARYLVARRKHSAILNLSDQVSSYDPQFHALRIEGRRRHIDRLTGILVRMDRRGLAHIDGNARTIAAALIAMMGSVAFWSAECPQDYASLEDTVTAIWARAIGLDAPSPKSSPDDDPARTERAPIPMEPSRTEAPLPSAPAIAG